MVNSIGLGIIDYKFENLKNDFENYDVKIPQLNYIMDKSEAFFTIMFTLEMVIKTIGQGLILDKNCYLRDYWNWLDSIVVVGSILSYLPNGANVSILRTFRLFKPLRSLRNFPAMKELVVTLLESVQQLTNIFLLMEFALLLFSILGIQIWRGLFNYHCRLTEFPVDGVWEIDPENTRVCGGMNTCAEGQYCGSLYDYYKGSNVVDENLHQGVDENFGITNFDNIFHAHISVFQATTLEGWFQLMTLVSDGYNKYITIIYFLGVIQVCHYLLVNLTLAVMVQNLHK